MAATKRPAALLLGITSPNALYGLVRNELLPALVPNRYLPVVVRLNNRDLCFDVLHRLGLEPYGEVLRQVVNAHMLAAGLGQDWRDQLKLIVAGTDFRLWTKIDDRERMLNILGLTDTQLLTLMRERSGTEREYRHGAAMFTVME